MKTLLGKLTPNYRYSPFAYQESWLSVDPIIGCKLNCRYCFMRITGWTASRPEVTMDVSTTLRQLSHHPRFTPNQTILSFGNQTDPFLAENVQFLCDFVDGLESAGYSNPLALVTKSAIPGEVIQKLRRLRHVRPVFFLSYSGLPKRIERGVVPEHNEQNLRNLAAAGLPVIHFWRPLVEANGDPLSLRRVLDVVAPYALASVYIGLKVTPDLVHAYGDIPELQVPNSLRNYHGDCLPDGLERRLRAVAAETYPDYPLYLHTSCAMSLALRVPDYNATMYDHPACAASQCPDWKRQVCENSKKPPRLCDIHAALSQIGVECGFEIRANHVRINGTLNQEDYTFLLHRLNFPVRADSLLFNQNLRGSILRQYEGVA